MTYKLLPENLEAREKKKTSWQGGPDSKRISYARVFISFVCERTHRCKALKEAGLYSKCDIDRLEQVKCLLQKMKINVAGAKEILDRNFCWEVRKLWQKN